MRDLLVNMTEDAVANSIRARYKALKLLGMAVPCEKVEEV